MTSIAVAMFEKVRLKSRLEPPRERGMTYDCGRPELGRLLNTIGQLAAKKAGSERIALMIEPSFSSKTGDNNPPIRSRRVEEFRISLSSIG